MRTSLLIFFAILLAAPAVSAEGHPTMETALEQAFTSGGPAGLAALVKEDATYRHVLVAERIPGGDVVVEAAVDHDGRKLRIPVKLQQEAGAWSVAWAPEPDYTEGLISMVDSGRMLKTSNAPRWRSAPRLPAFPIIVTAERIITPLGVTPQASASTEEDEGKKAALTANVGLLKHTQRWIDEVLRSDPAPASFDVIADEEISWTRLNEVVYSVSAAGLYRIMLVGTDGKEMSAIPVAAPIGAASSPRLGSPVVIGLYNTDEDDGFRVGYRKKIFRAAEPCTEEMSFCAGSADEFTDRLSALLKNSAAEAPAEIKLIMFAATGDVALKKVVAYLDVAFVNLELEPHHVLLGFIQR